MIPNTEQISSAAKQAAQRGNLQEAAGILAQGLAQHPEDVRLASEAASLALKRQSHEDAVHLYRRAVTLDPDNLELRIDLAIALGAGGYAHAALAELDPLEGTFRVNPRYWSVRANSARLAGATGKAADYYDRCLGLKPDHPRALHGRARVALERGEDRASARFDRALQASPSEADLWLGKAQALDAEGDTQAARELAEQLVNKAPHWIDALDLLAQLRSATGETDFDSHYFAAAERMSDRAEIPIAHVRHLASRDEYENAAEVAAKAARRFPDSPYFALAHATNAGMAGQLDQADQLFSDLSFEGPDRALQEGRQRLRRGDLDKAEKLLVSASRSRGTAHTAYALLGIVWRLTGDTRAHWLHGQNGLVNTTNLQLSEDKLDEIIGVLEAIHDHSAFPVGQSLRGGTQTRHVLFHRHETVLQALHQAILAALEVYRSQLPPRDSKHPLLRHRDDPWRLAGSWSVRLQSGGDHHAPHIHPQGVLSSASYLIIPNADAGEGCLEIGAPPADLQLDLPPLHVIQPEKGHLALFPSTLFHGTTPFEGGKRMTVAFDVVPMVGPPDG